MLEEPRLTLLGPDGAAASSAGEPGSAQATPDSPAAESPAAAKRTQAAKKRSKPTDAHTDSKIVRLPATAPAADATAGLPDEVLAAGTPDQPGRRIRVRQFNRQ